MQELIKVDYKENTALARDVYEFVYEGQEKRQAFTHWFNRTVKKYGFVETKDFMPIWTESTGGRPSVDYVVSFDMGKELCMISATKNGNKARKYFLKCEKIAQKYHTTREIGKEVRKSLTDAVQESGEQERTHGHGYSLYTNMVYDITGVKHLFDIYKSMMKAQGLKPDKFRETLKIDELKRVELAESLIKPLLELDKQYSEIKETLKPLFNKKEIE